MTTTIEQLQKVVNDESKTADARKQAAELILKLQATPDDTGIADDDPELVRLMKYWNEPFSEIPSYRPAESILDLYSIDVTTKLGAKKMLARDRKEKRLEAIMHDESKSMSERITATAEWQSIQCRGSHWIQFSPEEALERRSPHPHWARLKKLRDLVGDVGRSKQPPQNLSELESGIKQRRAWFHEFVTLAAEFPYRETPVLLHPRELIGGWVYNNTPEPVSQYWVLIRLEGLPFTACFGPIHGKR